MFLAVAAGAFGAHGLKNRLPADLLAIFEVGVRYHAYHALALVACGLAAGRLAAPRALAVAGSCFTAGILVFSGSLYLLALTGQRWLGAITPLGGAAFLAGWLAFAYAGLRRTN